jgi:DNA-binding PadR family transcriptional regulator
MYTSEAFLSLNGTSVKLLILFLGKRKLTFPKDRKGAKGAYVVENWDKLTMTYKELENKPFNFTRPRIARALDELLAKGFISIIDPGGAYRKHKTVYALSDLWQQWAPGRKPFNKRIRDAKRGFQGRGKGAVSTNKKTAEGSGHGGGATGKIKNLADLEALVEAEKRAKIKSTHADVTHRHTQKRYP